MPNDLIVLYETIYRVSLTERIQHLQGYPTRVIRVLIYIAEQKIIALRNRPLSSFIID